MSTPLYEQLTAECGFDPLEGIEYEEIRAMGHHEPIARARTGPSIHTLPRYRARHDAFCQWWTVEKLHYLNEYVATYQPQRIFHTEAEATEYADTMNEGE